MLLKIMIAKKKIMIAERLHVHFNLDLGVGRWILRFCQMDSF